MSDIQGGLVMAKMRSDERYVSQRIRGVRFFQKRNPAWVPADGIYALDEHNTWEFYAPTWADARRRLEAAQPNSPISSDSSQPDAKDARIAQLWNALERTLENCKRTVSGKPVRDLAETFAEADAALQQRPTSTPGGEK